MSATNLRPAAMCAMTWDSAAIRFRRGRYPESQSRNARSSSSGSTASRIARCTTRSPAAGT